MKNTLKLIGIIALVAVIGFAFAACGNEPGDPTHNHQWGAWAVTTSATCNAMGAETRVCALDATHKETRDIDMDPDAHNWQLAPSATAPTCTEDGHGVQICTHNEAHTTTGDIPAMGHDWDEWDVSTAPTCTEKGSGTKICKRDETHIDSGTDNIPTNPNAHNWNNSYTLTSPATCIATGIETDACSYDATHTRTQTIVINLDAHNWNNSYTVTTPATCTTEGIETDACSYNSSHTTTRTIVALGHAYGDWTKINAKSGVETKVCANNVRHTEGTRVAVDMVYVQSGSFQMGNPDRSYGEGTERPVHTVTLSDGFYLGKYEVTQAQWQAVMGRTQQQQQTVANGGSYNYGRGDAYPIYYVKWFEALVFCNKLSISEELTPAYRINNSTNPDDWGSVPTERNALWDAVEIVSGSSGYRLPTEAQWEYAAKGGDGSPGNYRYAGSNNFDDVALSLRLESYTVGTKAANGLGLYDMSGNVCELCWDWFGDYSSAAQTDPMGPPPPAGSGYMRVTRGGVYNSNYNSGHSASRRGTDPSSWSNGAYRGFRLLRPGE